MEFDYHHLVLCINSLDVVSSLLFQDESSTEFEVLQKDKDQSTGRLPLFPQPYDLPPTPYSKSGAYLIHQTQSCYICTALIITPENLWNC